MSEFGDGWGGRGRGVGGVTSATAADFGLLVRHEVCNSTDLQLLLVRISTF